MNFIKFIVWLGAGAIVGWFASRMVEKERRTSKVKMISSEGES